MPSAAAAAERFQVALRLSPAFARLLAARGWSETAAVVEFLYPRLEHTHSPWLMLGMTAAVDRILAAIAAGEPLRVMGDYDADGTLATVIMRQALQSLGAQVSYHLPQRLTEGYGLQVAGIEAAHREGVRLLITVDTGIRDLAPLERARELGLDVIVTDHHLPGDRLPPALAILNPHQGGCGYPDKGLCGSGVAFKLVHAVLEKSGRLTEPWPPALRSYLKLVAMGTIADSVPLLGENRVLARFGLQGLREPVNPGLRALLAVALPPANGNGNGAGAEVTAADVGYRIAPRLNAAGRMGAADQVVELFFAARGQAEALAQSLEALNLRRQEVCAAIEAELDRRFATQPECLTPALLLLAGEGWHRGVLGIVASRVLQRTAKPVLIVALEREPDGSWQAHGSGRSPAGFHLLERFEQCRPVFEGPRCRFGGHAQAIGFSLPATLLPVLEMALLAGLAAAPAGATAAAGAVEMDLRLAELTLDFAKDLQRLQPMGEANPEPWFHTRGVTVATPPLRLKERHMKLTLEQEGARAQALHWNLWRDGVYAAAPERPAWAELRVGTRLDITYRVEYSRHPQYGERVQLILRDFRHCRAVAVVEAEPAAGLAAAE